MFAYPDRRGDIPRHILDELIGRLPHLEHDESEHVCYGTVLSREQYLLRRQRPRLRGRTTRAARPHDEA